MADLYYFDVYNIAKSKSYSNPQKVTDGGYVPRNKDTFYASDKLDTSFNSKTGFKKTDELRNTGNTEAGQYYYIHDYDAIYEVYVIVLPTGGGISYNAYLRYECDIVETNIKGSFSGRVTGTKFEYPYDGEKNGKWYVRRGLVNKPPIAPDEINVPDTIISEQEIQISWSKSTDPDGDRVGYSLERRINSEGWIQIYQGNDLNYSDYLSRNTDTVQYRVRAYDDKGATSEWGTTDILNVIHNRPPTISGADEDLGIKDGGFEISYKISDLDKDDKVRVIITLDGKVIYSKENHELDKDSSIIITDDDFLSISPGEHTILIKAIDNSNAMDIRIYTFNRIINETTVTLKEPLSSGQDISKAIMSINKTVPPEVETTVLVTNNAYDEKPVWIDVTQNVVQSRKIFFENQVATAGKFGFNFKISIKRNSDGEPAYIRSVGGNFE